jgi:hypothetical protein
MRKYYKTPKMEISLLHNGDIICGSGDITYGTEEVDTNDPDYGKGRDSQDIGLGSDGDGNENGAGEGNENGAEEGNENGGFVVTDDDTSSAADGPNNDTEIMQVGDVSEEPAVTSMVDDIDNNLYNLDTDSIIDSNTSTY